MLTLISGSPPDTGINSFINSEGGFAPLPTSQKQRA
jgi:hypothetical protein